MMEMNTTGISYFNDVVPTSLSINVLQIIEESFY